SYFKYYIYTIPIGSVFMRQGINSILVDEISALTYQNMSTIIDVLNNSRNRLVHSQEGDLDFLNTRRKDMTSDYKVTNELYKVRWAGNKKVVKGKTYYSRVDIELINEQVKLFYSALDEVSIDHTDDTFSITEYVSLGLNDKTSYYPLEEVIIRFHDNGYYKIDSNLIFDPPQYNRKMMYHIYNSNLSLLAKLEKGISLSEREKRDMNNLPSTFMICYLNGFEDAKDRLIDAKPLLKAFEDPSVYVSFKEAM